jgi:hypothetical protein
MEGVIHGRIVHYVLSEIDAETINARRTKASIPQEERLPGVVYPMGNKVEAGEHVVMLITKVWNENGLINGRCLLDGNDDFWVTSKSYDAEDKKQYSWHWIEKA